MAVALRRTRLLPAAILLVLTAGCAWFQEPPSLAPETAPSGAGEPGRSLNGLPPGTGAPADTGGAGFGASLVGPLAALPESSAAAAAPPEASEGTAAGVPSAAAPAPPRTAPSRPMTAPPDTGGVPGEAVSGSDQWNLTGDELHAATTPQGQEIRITHPTITQGDLVISSPQGTYFVDPRTARLTDGVAFSEGSARGTSNTATYDRNDQTLTAVGDVNVYSPGDSLHMAGDRGVYDRERRVFTLTGHVHGERNGRLLTSREAEWHRDEKLIYLTGDVRVVDPVAKSTVTGQRLTYDLTTDRARVTQAPELALSGSEEGVIRAVGDRLWLEPSGNAYAGGNVRVTRGGVTATADSAAFDTATHRAFLFGSPRVVEQDGTLTGDTLILVFDENRVLERADMHGDAMVRYAPVDTTVEGEVSVVRGDSLSMYFGPGGAERVETFGDARSTYTPSPADAAAGAGTNAARGDTITIFIEANRVDRVRINGHAKGVYVFEGEGEAGGDSARAAPDTLAAAPDTAGAAADTSLAAATRGLLPTAEELGAAPGAEKVLYESDTILYSMSTRIVDLAGDAKLEYGDLTLTAGKVKFYTERKYLEAEEKPVLVQGGGAGGEQRVVGAHMDYGLRSKEGTIAGGRTKAQDGFIYSDALRKISDDQFLAREGSYTTCDNIEHDTEPHYHFTSKKMRIYLKDKVIAKPVVLYIRDIPIFALPFYVFSINRGRQSGFLTPDLDFGLTGSSGRFFRNLGYYWAASPYFDLTVSSEYAEASKRFVGRGKVQYAKRYLMSGYVDAARTIGSTTKGYDITGSHQMSLGDWRMTGRAEFRNSTFRRNEPLGTDFGTRFDRLLKSDLSVSRNFSAGSLFLTASRQVDLAPETTPGTSTPVVQELLPSYSLSLKQITLGRKADAKGEGARLPALANLRIGFSSRGSSSFTRTQTTYSTAADTLAGTPADTVTSTSSERQTSATHTFTVSDSRRVLNALNLQPSLSLNDYWVDREFSAADTVKGFHQAAVWSASLGTGTSLYGTFPGIGPVTALRHTFEPSASFTYHPAFAGLSYIDTSGVKRNRYPGISSFESRQVNLGLRNALEIKVRSGEGTRKLRLLDWSLNSGYDFTAHKRGELGWSPVNSTFNLPRILGVDLNFNSTHDPYHQFRFTNFQTTAIFGFRGALPGQESGETVGQPRPPGEEPTDWDRLGGDLAGGWGQPVGSENAEAKALDWNAGFSVSYSGSRQIDRVQTQTRVNSQGSVQITKNWSVSYTNSWDVDAGKLTTESLSLHRDLHCWEASFTRSRAGSINSFFFRINVKSLPDIKYEQGQNPGTGLDTLTRFLP